MARTITIINSMAGAAALSLLTAGGPAAAQDWQPTRPVDFVIMAGAGGGADQIARFIQSVVEQEDLTNRPLVPNNKGGGSGAEALILLNETNDPDHTILVTLNSYFTTPLRQEDLGVDVTTFTPVALMAVDPFVLWVHADSGITSFEQWVETVKEAGDYIMAGTGTGQEDSLVISFLEQEFDLNINYIPFAGGGEVAAALAGKQASATVNNPAEAKGFYEAGDVVPLVAFSDERLDAYPDVPTIKELGHDFSYYNQRAIVGAPGMSDEAAAFYQDTFEAVFNTEAWQGYMESESLTPLWLSPDEQVEYWQSQIENHRNLLSTMEE